ncbi:MAG: GNAT family N-acetyltransferase [Acidimicrobiales bacterium]
MSDPAVRRALPADAEAVTRVIERAIRVSAAGAYPADAVEAWARGRTVEAVRAMIEVTDGFVATIDQVVVGWANLDGDEVDQLYVDPDAGGRGVARRLYETIEALARANGLDQVRAVASLRAEPAFRRLGFREIDTDEIAFNGHTFTVVRMAKRLERPLPSRAVVRRGRRRRGVAGPRLQPGRPTMMAR